MDTQQMSLDQWLHQVLAPGPNPENFVDYQFPSDEYRDEFLETIGSRTELEIRGLLRSFLVQSTSLGADRLALEYYWHLREHAPERFASLSEREFYHRLVRWTASGGKTPPPWEGITWIWDLLPHYPREALAALDSYFLAHAQLLPDGRLLGLGDATSIIQARYIGAPQSRREALDELVSGTSRDFECLVERLYSKMGYATVLTPAVKDGGLDVRASHDAVGRAETLLVECKRYRTPVGVGAVRSLLGVVSDQKVNKGIIVATSSFTHPARRLADSNPRIELVDGNQFVELMNEYCGPTWTLRVRKLVLESTQALQHDVDHTHVT